MKSFLFAREIQPSRKRLKPRRLSVFDGGRGVRDSSAVAVSSPLVNGGLLLRKQRKAYMDVVTSVQARKSLCINPCADAWEGNIGDVFQCVLLRCLA